MFSDSLDVGFKRKIQVKHDFKVLGLTSARMLPLTGTVDGRQSKFGGWGKIKTLILDILNLCCPLEIYMVLKREVWAGKIHVRLDIVVAFKVGSLGPGND